MRAFAAFASLALISGCGGEPAFEDRYDEQAKQINAMADNIQEELAGQLDASAGTEAALSTNR